MDQDDSIAIVGVGCIFPGAKNLEEFWRVLSNEEDHIKEIPPDRFPVNAFYDADPDVPGKTYVRSAGLIEDHDKWDNQFFGMSEKEAQETDPQQRHVLECVHMAMQDGGITRNQINGSPTGVYIGVMNNDFKPYKGADTTRISNYSVTGESASIISARVSHFYNMLGPSITLDTACSSSLVAIHTAIAAIQSGDIEMAVCGGVSSILSPETFVTLSKANMASPSGHCHTFSRNADGYVRGEGSGIVILKCLKQAITDRNKIWATIVAGCNQDGRTNTPITAPSQSQQEKLLEAVYLGNSIDPSLIQYIEAHGTGTPIGDPIEVNALGSFFGKYMKERSNKIKLGSVKTNIGHLESASGVAGLLKVLLMMKYETIVKSLHSEPLNPNIPFERYNLEVAQTKCDWSSVCNGSRFACVNNFGFGGTNSHVVVQQYNESEAAAKRNCDEHDILSKIVTFSAESQESLVKYIHCICEFLQTAAIEFVSMTDLSYTTCVRRDHFRYRLMFWANDIEEIKDLLRRINTSQLTIYPVPIHNPRVILVYPGVGTTWKGMCKEFIDTSAIFKRSLQQIDKYLEPLTGWSIMQKFTREKDVVADPFVNHIALCSCQIALTNVWMHLGLKPRAIVGQSVGEVAAAYASKSLSLEQAVSVMFHRSQVLRHCSGGGMTAVLNCQSSAVEEACRRLKCGKVSIAVYLSDLSCTVSGDKQAIEELKKELKSNTQDAVVFKDLNVKCAYHSHYTADAGDKLQHLLRDISCEPPQIPVFSSVTGRQANLPYYSSASYWADNVKNPVFFKTSILNASTESKHRIFLEVSPIPFMHAHLCQLFPDSNELTLASLHRNKERQTFLGTCKKLYESGVNFNWENVADTDANFIKLPNYVYTKRPFPLESEGYLWSRNVDNTGKFNGLLQRKAGAINEFTLAIDMNNTPFVYEHIVDGLAIVPGALYGEVGLELGYSQLGIHPYELEVSWTIDKPCIVRKHEKQSVTVTYEKQNDRSLVFRVSSNVKEITLVNGKVVLKSPSTHDAIVDIQDMTAMMRKEKRTDIYKLLRNFGFEHGETFQLVNKYTLRNDEGFAEIELTPSLLKESDRTYLHPVILDCMMQCTIPFVGSATKSKDSKILPDNIGSLVLFQQPIRHMFCYTKFYGSNDNSLVANILLLRPDGVVIAEMKDFEVRIVNGPQDLSSITYELSWENWNMKVPQNLLKSSAYVMMLEGNFTTSLKAAFTKWGIYIEACKLSPKDDISTVIKKVKGKIVGSKSSTTPTLVFIPGFVLDGTIPEWNINVYGYVQRTCHFLMRLVQEFGDISINIVCVTERTQAMDSHVMENINILGSELWGMVRSIVQETNTCKLYMVDVSPSMEKTVEEIAQIIACISNCYDTVQPEIKICDSKFYSTKLTRLRSVKGNDQLSVLKSRENENLWIKLESNNDTLSTFGIPKDSEPVPKLHHHLKLEAAFVCRKSNLFSTEQIVSYRDHWPQQRHMGYSIIAYEMSGYLLDSNKQKGNCKHETISCFPIELSTDVCVPKELVAFKSDIPEYTPGMLHKTMLSLQIAHEVEPNSQVCIFHDDSLPGLLELLKIMLLDKACSIDTVIKESNFGDIRSVNSKYIIVAQQHTTKTIKEYIDVAPNAQELITVCGCFPNYSLRDARRRGRIGIRLFDQAVLLCIRQLPVYFQRAITWLKKFSKLHMLPVRKFAHDSDIITYQGLQDIQVKMPQELVFRAYGAYIVVGGLTGLGWMIVKWLCSNGAKYVITLSRKSVNKEMSKRICNIQRLYGVQIYHFPVDICDQVSLSSTFEKIRQIDPNVVIKGIFQGAGVTDDAMVRNMTEDKLYKPLKPKVLGTWNLHLISLDLKLDYFVMHSSIASTFGHGGQSNYAAANAFLDSMAAFRRGKGLPAQTINWGALEVGMANDKTVQERLKSDGIFFLNKQQILTCFMQTASSTVTQISFADVRWNVFARQAIGTKFYWSKFFAFFNPKSDHEFHNGAKLDVDIPEYMKLSLDERLKTTTDCVRAACSKVFAVDKLAVDTKSVLAEYGLDSQKAIELVQSLYDITKIRIPYLRLSSGEITIEDLAQFIVEESENEIQKVNVDDVAIESISGSPTYLEKVYLDMLENDPNNPHLSIAVDVKISGRDLSSEFFLTILQALIMLYPELRTKFRYNEGEKRWGIRKEVVDPEDAIADCKIIQQENEFQKSLEAPNSYNPTHDFPVRALIYKCKTEALLRLTFSHCLIDIVSWEVIMNDIRNIISSLIRDEHLPKSNKKEPIDAAVLMEEILQLKLQSLEMYWKSQLQIVTEIPSLKTENDVSVCFTDTWCVQKQYNTKLVESVQHYLKAEKQTFFSLMCTIYQIVLQKHSKSNAISVIGAVNLRHYDLTELKDRVGLGVNFVPLIADFRDCHLPLQDIFSRNCKVIQQALRNSLYPYVMLTALDCYDSRKHSRHAIMMEDITRLDDDFQCTDVHVKFTHLKAGHDRSYETSLGVFYNESKSYLELRLGFNRDVVPQYTAETILENIQELLELFPSIPKIGLDVWTPKYDVTKILSSNPESELIQDSDYEENVTVRIVTENETDFLEWGNTTKTRLELADILDLKGRCIKGLPSMVLATLDTEYIFSSADTQLIEAWIVILERKTRHWNTRF